MCSNAPVRILSTFYLGELLWYSVASVHESDLKSCDFVDTETHGFVDKGSQYFVHSYWRTSTASHQQQITADIKYLGLLSSPNLMLGLVVCGPSAPLFRWVRQVDSSDRVRRHKPLMNMFSSRNWKHVCNDPV